MNTLKGFTLAEVLITLAIIGVVASITIPNMVKDIWKEQAETGLKKVYMTWTNALELAEKEHGTINDSNFASTDHFYDYFSYQDGHDQKSFVNLRKCLTTAGARCKQPTYKTMAGNNAGGNFHNQDYFDFYTQDGMTYKLVMNSSVEAPAGGATGKIAMLAVDINGHRGPNIVGVDAFYFVMCYGGNGSCWNDGNVYMLGKRTTGFYPMGFGHANKGMDGYYGCNRENENSGGGAYCAYRIMQNGWQIDY